MQCKVTFSTIGAFDSIDSNTITSDVDKNKTHPPHYTSIQVQVNYEGFVIWRMVVDKGEYTWVMLLLF